MEHWLKKYIYVEFINIANFSDIMHPELSLVGLKMKYCDRVLENLLFTFGCVFYFFMVRLWIRWRSPSSSAFLQSVCKLVREGKKKREKEVRGEVEDAEPEKGPQCCATARMLGNPWSK